MTSSTKDVWCSQQQDDSFMGGTAEQVDVWLLLEYAASWKARANDDNSLSAEVNNWLQQSITELAAADLKARPQFIRQPERDQDGLRFMLATKAGVWRFEANTHEEFIGLDVAGFVRQLAVGNTAAEIAPGFSCSAVEQPLYFVCMNGQRDRCCAKFGRPIYKGLEALGANVWHISHLGGHRFAPNVLCLPQGTVHGRLFEKELTDFFAVTQQGEVHFSTLRGRCWYPPIVQAAEAFIGQQRLHWVAQHGDDNTATVQFSEQGSTNSETRSANSKKRSAREFEITVKRSEQPTNLLASCGASATKAVYAFERAETG